MCFTKNVCLSSIPKCCVKTSTLAFAYLALFILILNHKQRLSMRFIQFVWLNKKLNCQPSWNYAEHYQTNEIHTRSQWLKELFECICVICIRKSWNICCMQIIRFVTARLVTTRFVCFRHFKSIRQKFHQLYKT